MRPDQYVLTDHHQDQSEGRHDPMIERVRQALIAKGYDPEVIERGLAQWKATGYGIDPNQIALRHYGTPSCQCFECAATPIEGYNLHGLPGQYQSVVIEAWRGAGV